VGGPHNGGCDTCTGVVTVDGDTVSRNAEYYTLGHLARFVQPGAKRIASTSFGTTGWNGQIMDAAFRNRDGTTALVVHNENDDPRTFAVAEGGYSFEYTLPGGALATFTWRDIDDGRELVPAHGTSPETANAFDDDASTRWTTGAAQQPGQSLVADLGRVRTVDRLVLDAGVDRGDFPRGYTLAVSSDGTTWRDVASGVGTGQLTTIDFPPTRARFLRVTQTGSAGNWWSVAEVRVSR
jgi:glucosylceramidase